MGTVSTHDLGRPRPSDRKQLALGQRLGGTAAVDGLLEAIATLRLKPADWRAELLGRVTDGVVTTDPASGTTTPERPQAAALQAALDAAASTARDGQQRGIDVAPTDLEDLLALRLALRDALAGSTSDSPLRHVVPWIWRPESTGQPLTESGRSRGMELRVSRYAVPRY